MNTRRLAAAPALTLISLVVAGAWLALGWAAGLYGAVGWVCGALAVALVAYGWLYAITRAQATQLDALATFLAERSLVVVRCASCRQPVTLGPPPRDVRMDDKVSLPPGWTVVGDRAYCPECADRGNGPAVVHTNR